jgi:protocatechuate 3,4-dioxygenase beta subunit
VEGTVTERNRLDFDTTRRRLVQALFVVPAAVLVGRGTHALGDTVTERGTAALPLTPACADGDDDPTPPRMEGPYFKPRSPERASLVEPGLKGTRLRVTGRVVTTSCAPIAGALLDFWHADDAGAYDNAGFRLRGHQFTKADGRFALETIVPAAYSGRTRHIHVKVQAPKGPILTTELYFPGEPKNASDGLFLPALLMTVGESAGGKQGAFTFVVATS